MKKQISIIWTIEDILTVDPTLTDLDASKVLELIEKTHDANIGITWDTIKSAIVNYKSENKI